MREIIRLIRNENLAIFGFVAWVTLALFVESAEAMEATEATKATKATEATEEKLKLNALPPEVWINIFSEDFKTLVQVNQVNKALKALTDPALAQKRLREIIPATVELKAGFFIMGPSPEEVALFGGVQVLAEIKRDFRMAVDPVTQKQFEAVMGKAKNNSEYKGAKLPVTNVRGKKDNYNEYLDRLNTEVGRLWPVAYPRAGRPPRFRLPTEKEWEYATTEPLSSPETVFLNGTGNIVIMAKHSVYSGTNSELDLERYVDCGRPSPDEEPSLVDEVEPNSRGIRGMSGGVCEMTSTPWSDHPVYPKGDRSGFVRRGGSWRSNAQYCRSAYRLSMRARGIYWDLGLRLVAD